MLEAIRRARPRQFLTFEELFAELVRFYLSYHRTLNGDVDRWLRIRANASQKAEDSREEEEPEREEDAREEPRQV